MSIVRLLAPVYMRRVLRFTQIEIHQPDDIIRAVQDFYSGKSRLLVAFRHPYGDEPQLMLHTWHNLLPRLARRRQMALPCRPHLRMLHDYAVPLWGDALIRFILPRVGAVPVYHAKTDPDSLRRIREILLNDPCPFGLAPEGQITYHSEHLTRIEQGAVRMGFWCVHDLAKAGRSERVEVLPVSIHYRYDERDRHKVVAALLRMAAACELLLQPDLNRLHRQSDADLASLQDAAESVEQRVLEISESFYRLHHKLEQPKNHTSTADAASERQRRWNALLETALLKAENILDLPPATGDVIERVYRIRQTGWDLICPATMDEQPLLERALAHRKAGEAWQAMRHMEFVDLMSYHQTHYLRDRPLVGTAYDRLVETVINLEDLITRLRGGNITNRKNVMRKKAILLPAPILDLTDSLQQNNLSGRQAVRQATAALLDRFNRCMEVYRDES